MADQEREKKAKLDFSEADVLFSDFITVNYASKEEVEIALCKKGPNEGSDVKVVKRLVVTTPHFFRLREMFNKVGGELEEYIEEDLKKSQEIAKDK